MKKVVCIHGMWGQPALWNSFKGIMEAQGFEVHTPPLPYHNSKEELESTDIGNVGLSEYISSIAEYIAGLGEPPIVVGHSMGGMVAQAVAAKGLASELILLNPAAPAGLFSIRLSVVRLFLRSMLKWGFWRKPIMLTWEEARWGVLNEMDEGLARQCYELMGPESGRAASEIAYWMFDKHKSSKVDFSQVTCPVLVIGSERDRIVPASVCRAVAKCYPQAVYKELAGRGHWTLDAEPLGEVIKLINEQLAV